MSASLSAAAHTLQTFYLQHHGWLVARLRRKIGCPWDAADLAQSTFLRAWTAPGPPLVVGSTIHSIQFVLPSIKTAYADLGIMSNLKEIFNNLLSIAGE